MRSTLFYIPHELYGIPVLGFGWLLGILVVGVVAWGVWLNSTGRLKEEMTAGLPIWIVAAFLVLFVLPQIETRVQGEPIGLPIRGYGVMVLFGLFSGIAITIRRAKQLQVSPELIVSLGFWMMGLGVIGARIFFVVQKWPSYAMLPPGERLVAIVKLTEGGLVIYGGMIGGLVAGATYCYLKRLAPLAVADLITPGFLIGLAFGRIGCLLNGCCFGGVCTADLPTITFPQGSLPYVSQVENGTLLGLQLQTTEGKAREILSVEPQSLGETRLHAKPGDLYFLNDIATAQPKPGEDPARSPDLMVDVSVGKERELLMPQDLPPRSLPVHPSQIYSAIDAMLLCCLIYCLQPWVRRDGQAFFVAVLLHGIARFTLELIRSDEAGQFGTSLTIAQWISIVGGTLALAALLATWRLPACRSWDWRAARAAL